VKLVVSEASKSVQDAYKSAIEALESEGHEILHITMTNTENMILQLTI